MLHNPALDLAPFGRWTLRDKAAQRRSAPRWTSQQQWTNRMHSRSSILAGFVLTTALVAGCATPIAGQIESLSAKKSCCTSLSKIEASSTLSGEMDLAFSDSTPAFSFETGLSPFIVVALPEGSEGRVLEIRATPEMMAVTKGNSLIFTPVAATFIDALGRPIVAEQDSGIVATNGGAMYMFIIARKIKVPSAAKRVVVYSNARLHGTSQTFQYKTVSYLLPVGNVFIPTGGASQVTAIYGVNGKFTIRLE